MARRILPLTSLRVADSGYECSEIASMNSVINETRNAAKEFSPSADLGYDQYFASLRALVDARLRVHTPAPESSDRLVEAAIHYSVKGGHRWRPLLLIGAYQT